MKNGNITIIMVTVMDVISGVLVLTNPHQLLVARLAIFYMLFPQPVIGSLVLFIVAGLTILGLRLNSPQKRFLCFLPQQLILFIKVIAVVDAVVLQHYADGIIRPWPFILVDQLPILVLAIGYFFAILDHEKKTKLP